MARSSGKRSREKAKRKQNKKRSKQKSSARFRTGAAAELVDHLLKVFVQTVRAGLDLAVSQPSQRAREISKEHLLWVLSSEMNSLSVTWAAFMAWDKPWKEFCRMVLADAEWHGLLSVSDRATLEERRARLDEVIPGVIVLAVHGALKAGDKQDNRPEADKKPVRAEFDRSIGVAQVIKLLKRTSPRSTSPTGHRSSAPSAG